MQLKYSNYVAFSHFHDKAVNNSGLFYEIFLMFPSIIFNTQLLPPRSSSS